MPGFSSNQNGDGIVYAQNADFSGASEPSSTILTDGKFWVGSTALNAGSTHINVGTIVSPSGSLIIGYISPNITLEAGTAIATTYVTNSGSAIPASNVLNVLGLSGSKTSGSGDTLTVKSPPFSQVGASATSSLNTGEFVNGAYTRTLPASAGLADGDIFIFVCTTASALVIQAVGAQKIRIGTLLSSAAGTATSTSIGDSLTLRYNGTDGFFYATSVVGTWLIA